MKKKYLKLAAFMLVMVLMVSVLGACADSGSPNDTDIPNVPDTPETPDIPDAPDTPEIPDEPEVPEEADVPDIPSVVDFLGTREDVEGVYLRGGFTKDFGRNHMPANEEEAKAFLDIIYAADFSKFVPVDDVSVSYGSLTFLINGVYINIGFGVTGEDSPLYMRIRKEPETLTVPDGTEEYVPPARYIYSAPRGTVDTAALAEVTHSMRTNTTDPDYSAIVTIAGEEPNEPIFKVYSYSFKYNADGLLNRYSTTEAPEGVEYNVTVQMGDTIYKLNSDTGDYLRQMDGEIIYGLMPENWLSISLSDLGVGRQLEEAKVAETE